MQQKFTPKQPGYTCAMCGALFHMTPFQRKQGRRFCSRTCKDKGQAEFWQSRRDAVQQAGVKTCTRCGETKPVSAFGKHLQGTKSRCRQCMSEDATQLYYRDHEATKAYHRAYHDKNRDRQNKTARRWRERNREYVVRYQREYNRINREQKRESYRRIRRNEPAHIRYLKNRVLCDRRRARIARTRYVENVDRALVIERDGRTCYICDTILHDNEIQIDHVVPLSRGGEHSRNNLRVCCRTCNLRKGARLWTEIVGHYPDMAKRVRSHIERFLI